MNLEKAVMATKLIDADTIVHYQTYDDEYEEFPEHKSTIAELLDMMTDEGCPEAVDAVPLGVEMWEDRFNIQTRTWRTKDGETEAKSFIITRRKQKDG